MAASPDEIVRATGKSGALDVAGGGHGDQRERYCFERRSTATSTGSWTRISFRDSAGLGSIHRGV
jgi:hypothetical protein